MSIFERFSQEQKQVVIDCIKKCGCMCHYHPAMHFVACCDASGTLLSEVEGKDDGVSAV